MFEQLNSIIEFYKYEFNQKIEIINKNYNFIIRDIITGIVITMLDITEIEQFFDIQADITEAQGL